MKKLLLSIVLIINIFAGVPKDAKSPYSGCSGDPGFELWNNTSSPIYYSYVTGGGDPLQKGFIELKADQKDCANMGKSNKAKLAIATRKPQIDDTVFVYSIPDAKNVYVKVVTEKGKPKAIPQSVKILTGNLEVSGFSAKGNVPASDLKEEIKNYSRADVSDIVKYAKELLTETAKPNATANQIEAILAKGAKMNINIQDERSKTTPLMNAVKNSNIDVVKLLLKNNAKIDLKDVNNETAFDLAILQLCSNKRSPKAKEILKVLFEAGAR